MPDIFARMLLGCRATTPFSLPRDSLTGRPAVRCDVTQCIPFVRVSCRSVNSTNPTRTTCCEQVARILVRHVRSLRDILARTSRGCYTRKLLPWKLGFTEQSLSVFRSKPPLRIHFFLFFSFFSYCIVCISMFVVFATMFLGKKNNH